MNGTFYMSGTSDMVKNPCPTGSIAGMNPFLVLHNTLVEQGKSYFAGVTHLRGDYGTAPKITLIDSRILTMPLKALTLEDLVDLSGANPDDREALYPYLSSLRDSFVLMLRRIMEKYPMEWNERLPSSFEEREIYDSVTGIMEDDELDDLNASMGGSPVLIDMVLKVQRELFDSLEARLVKTKFWRSSDLSIKQTSKHENGALILLPGSTGPSSSLVIEKELRNVTPVDFSQKSVWFWLNPHSEVEKIAGNYLGK
jgi:hypothetical protein